MPNGLFHLAFIGPGGSEILVVMLVLLLMFGAKDAPRMFRKLNDMLNQLRSAAENFKQEVMYSDLDGDTDRDRTKGEYTEYGLNGEDGQEDVAVSADEVAKTDAGSESEVNPDAGADTIDGGDGDVQKT